MTLPRKDAGRQNLDPRPDVPMGTRLRELAHSLDVDQCPVLVDDNRLRDLLRAMADEPEFGRERIEELEFELDRVKRERDEISDSLAKKDEQWRRIYNVLREYQNTDGGPVA